MWIGLIVCLVVAAVSTWLGGLQTVIGAPMIGMILGMIIANVLGSKRMAPTRKGCDYSSKVVLRAGIILAGGTMSFKTVMEAGGSALPFIIISICLAFLTACLVGTYLIKVTSRTKILVAGGTSICGGTAVATLASVLDADDNELAYAMSAIFFTDIIAALMWPYVAVAMQFTDQQFAVLAGIAINDVASVTAAAATFDNLTGGSGGDLAIAVKMTRVTMLVFVALAVMIWDLYEKGKKEEQAEETAGKVDKKVLVKKIAKAFPVFILGFLALALINTIVDFSSISIGALNLEFVLKKLNKFLITMALVGVGCKINLKDMLRSGVKPVLLGGVTWIVVALFTFSYVNFFM